LVRKGIQLGPRSAAWRPLTNDDVQKVVDASLKVLSKVGAYVEDPSILKTADKNGCTVNYDKNLVYFPEHVVSDFIKRAPKKFLLAGRSETDDVAFDGVSERAYGSFSSPMPKVCLWDEKSCEYFHRDATENDLLKAVRLYDALEHVDLLLPPILDMDAARRGLPQAVHEVCATLSGTTRHVNLANAAPKSPDEWDYFVRLATEVVGGEEELRKRPIISGMSLFTPPLILSKVACNNLLGPTKHGLPVLLGGNSAAPLTNLNACNTVVHHASVLSNITLSQMLRPGTPCVINVWGVSLDARHATMNFVAPENQLLNATLIQMVHDHVGLPVNFSPAQSAKITDIQAAYEATIATCFQWITGCDLWTNYTFNDYEFNPEMLIFQNDLAEYFNHMGKRFADTLPTNGNIALDTIEKCGPTVLTNYITHKVTLESIPLQYNPELADYRSFGSWSKDRKNMLEKIREKVRTLEQHEPPKLPEGVTERMKTIVKEADHKLAT